MGNKIDYVTIFPSNATKTPNILFGHVHVVLLNKYPIKCFENKNDALNYLEYVISNQDIAFLKRSVEMLSDYNKIIRWYNEETRKVVCMKQVYISTVSVITAVRHIALPE